MRIIFFFNWNKISSLDIERTHKGWEVWIFKRLKLKDDVEILKYHIYEEKILKTSSKLPRKK